MRRDDLPWLGDRLSELAEALGQRAPAPKGMLVWIDALAECHADTVKAALSDWPKVSTKMPVPFDILKACRERASRHIEDVAKRRGETAPSLNLPRPDSPIARAEMAKIRELLADCKPGLVAGTWQPLNGRPDQDPKEWAKVLRVREETGDQLSLHQRQAWREALATCTDVELGFVGG